MCWYNTTVKMRGMSNNDVNLTEDTFTNCRNVGLDAESLPTNICLDFKMLEGNQPLFTLTDLQLNIFSVFQRLNDGLISEKKSGAVIKDLQWNILSVESRLEKEKRKRSTLQQFNRNTSFDELDIIREVKTLLYERTLNIYLA